MIRFTVCYDISQSKRRTRLSKALEEFGERVQYSVFEFKLTKAQHIRLLKTLQSKGFMQKNKQSPQDSITFYYFNDNTIRKIRRVGPKPVGDRDHLVYI
ncbi:MAG: CRISPR-associated endonuclease Cas2 [Candidatus Dojkabacteria bacterium]|nr:CRISPR-associated endonuclease Cas2 [Candidatus Dojkabacteria bacterium]